MTTTSTSSIRRTGKRRKGFIPILSSEASTSIRSMLFIGISVWLLSIGRMDLPLPTLPFRLYCPRHPTRLWALRNEDDRRWTVAAVTRARQKEATAVKDCGLPTSRASRWIKQAKLYGLRVPTIHGRVSDKSCKDGVCIYGRHTHRGTDARTSVRYSQRTALFGFDKDDAGRQLLQTSGRWQQRWLPSRACASYHPLGCYKDWNDALLNKKSAELIAKGEPDTFDYAEFIAAGKAEKQREKEEKNTYHRSV